MSGLPPGTVTVLFTDIEGSTVLLQRIGDTGFAHVLAQHHRLLRDTFGRLGGTEVGAEGDAFLVVFPSAADAVAAAIAGQQAIAAHPWPSGEGLRVRMGMHTGEPVHAGKDYVGLDVHRAARICAAAHGGQVLLSRQTASLVEDKLPAGTSLRDLGQHRLKDLREPERLFQILHPGLPADFPPLRSLRIGGHHLPRPLSSFVGRERELAELRRLLASTRLLTLTGTGGCGKTRMSLATAMGVLEEYPDGVWFVELGALSDPGLVLPTVASALDVREAPGRSLDAMLMDELRPKQLLLILDNCEHLVDACATLAAATLQASPGLRVLATSREVLGVPGETVWRVPSLSFPDPQHLPPLEDLMDYEAIRLFVERAATVRQNFTLTPDNARAVAEVCRHLDGIPLAIELAAARTPTLSAEEIAARLGDRFRLLTQGSRTALPRQQTLRAAMDWGYQLLTPAEQAAMRRLSIFSGGWTLAAAEAVCEGGHMHVSDTLDLLTQLVLKSWVLTDEQHGSVRYGYLETVAQYGREQLADAREVEAARKRHLEWYVTLAEHAEPELVGAQQAAWLDRLAAEHDNLRAAMEWATTGHDTEAGLRIAGAVWRFWFIRGHFVEGRKWLETLLRGSEHVPPAIRAKALQGAGSLAVFGQSDFVAGERLQRQALALWRDVGSEAGIAAALNGLGMVATGQGEYASARDAYEQSLAIRRRLGDTWGIANSLHNLGRVVQRQGDFETAHALIGESLTIWRERGDKQNMAMALVNLGFVACNRGDYASARSLIDESLVIRQELRDERGIAYALEGFACLAAAQGQARRAAQLFGAAEALREVLQTPLPPADHPYDAPISAARTELGDDAFSTAWHEGRAMTLEDAVREARSLS